MDYVEVGEMSKKIRKASLQLTQAQFGDKTGLELKKISRIECGYQLPDEEYFDALEHLRIDDEIVNAVRGAADDARRTMVIKRQGTHPNSENLMREVETIKELAARNNLMLREVLKNQKNGSRQNDLLTAALQPIEY